MRNERTKQTLKLRLLALVLVLALVWYSLNPAPKPVTLRKSEDEPADEKQRIAEPQNRVAATLPIVFKLPGEALEALPPSDKGVDDFDWPEYIDG
jgi:hypothetical protein